MLVFSQKLADYLLVKKTKKSWDYRVTQIVLEMLAHRTPPSCVSANILTVVEILFPKHKIIHELPSLRFVRAARTILLQVTKTLAAYQIGNATTFSQLFSDGTSRRQTSIQNVIMEF